MRLRGTVRAPGMDGPVVGAARLTIEDGRSVSATGRKYGFVLELEDGSRVTISTLGAEVVPERRIAGAYREVDSDPLWRLFDVVPGPDVRCTLAGAAIHDGDRVEVEGQPTAQRFAEDSGDFRTAPRQVVTALAAELIGHGPDPARAIDDALDADERDAERAAIAVARAEHVARHGSLGRVLLRGAWGVAHVVPFIAALLLLVSLPASSARGAAATCAMVLWLIGAGAMWAFFRSAYPRVVVGRSLVPVDLGLPLGIMAYFGLVLYPSMLVGPAQDAYLVTGAAAGSLVLLTMAMMRRARGVVGTLRAIAAAPPRTPETSDGTWCSIAGQCEGARIAGVTVVRQGAIVHSARLRGGEPEILSAVAAGRVTGDVMRATGPASLLLFLCRDPAPRGVLARLVRQRRVTLFVMMGAALLALVVAVAVHRLTR